MIDQTLEPVDERRILRVALDWAVEGIDPPRAGGGWNTGRVVQHTHESLVEDDFDTPPSTPGECTRLTPCLAEAIDVSEDMRHFVFRIRPGVKFHDGAALDAAAVAANYARMCDPGSTLYSPQAGDFNRTGIETISQVNVIDSMTVEFVHRQPAPEFLRYMTQQDAPGAQALVSPRALKAFGPHGCTDQAPGTGPFYFEERFDTPGGSAVMLRANEHYWQGRPWLSGIQFLPFPILADRVRALEEGVVDVAYSLEGADLERLAAQGFTVPAFSPPYLWYLVLNMQDPLMSDLRVRRAIAHAIDRVSLSESLFPGATLPACSALPPGSPAHDPQATEHYQYDPALARALLVEAGVQPGTVIRAIAAQAGSAQLDPTGIQSQIARDLAKVGLRLETELHPDWVGYFNGWREGAPEGVSISEMSWGMSCDSWLAQILHSKNCSPAGFNAGYAVDDVLDDLLDRASIQVDSEERIALYRAADRRIMETLPILPLLTSQRGMLAFSSAVKGLVVVNQCWQDFRRVQLTRLSNQQMD
ncbi:ABC transporter substrate-binding protein [Pseudomonas putida]|mgnify:CR=1 FL=1|uniref:ABC transporter substrate-binding protein n=1 Tax=Pseudomonas putida TaxID=303 RepID=UPI000629EAEB|nr:ABC transporter substrate-binding protein [Pseudomonas putida]